MAPARTGFAARAGFFMRRKYFGFYPENLLTNQATSPIFSAWQVDTH